MFLGYEITAIRQGNIDGTSRTQFYCGIGLRVRRPKWTIRGRSLTARSGVSPNISFEKHHPSDVPPSYTEASGYDDSTEECVEIFISLDPYAKISNRPWFERESGI
jgi:hypothetical protein